MWDNILYGQLPYLLITIAVVGTIYRYQTQRFTWSSQSSEFLENKSLFYGSFPWHYGVVLILCMHILAIFIPGGVLAWNSVPVRLYILELSGLSLGILAFFGLLVFIYRRLTDARVKSLTTTWDVIVLIVLLIQILTGLANAILYRWGSNWYAATAVPWIWSIITLQPNVEFVKNLPLLTKVHILNAMLFIVLIPFTRLVHILAFIGPLKYITRPYQVVRWYKERAEKTENIVQYK